MEDRDRMCVPSCTGVRHPPIKKAPGLPYGDKLRGTEFRRIQLKSRYALVAAGIVSSMAAAPAFSQADNTNSRWSPSPFDTNMQRYQTYNFGADSTSYYGGDARYYYSGEPTYYYYRYESGYPRGQPLVIGRLEPNLVYGPTPNQVQPGTSLSNPTGTELQGQNSGGK